MNKYRIVIFFALLTTSYFSQKEDTLYIDYYFNDPYAFTENNLEKGIEIDIINEYMFWLKAKKKIGYVIKYKKFEDFDLFYTSVQRGSKNSIGLGSVTINKERLKEIDFSTPYLKNVAFCITNGNATDVKTKSPDDVTRTLGNMSALTMVNTSLEKYAVDIKKQFVPDMKLLYFPNEHKILDEISRNVLYFGYVDAISFWFYLKQNPRRFLKMQKALNQSNEQLGLIMPKGSQHKALFNEFFTAFANSPKYRGILEKYLGSYMTQNVAIN